MYSVVLEHRRMYPTILQEQQYRRHSVCFLNNAYPQLAEALLRTLGIVHLVRQLPDLAS